MRTSLRPARTASSTTYWIAGLSTTGSISFGVALVAGRNRVPSPAAGMTAFRTGALMRSTLTRIRVRGLRDHPPLIASGRLCRVEGLVRGPHERSHGRAVHGEDSDTYRHRHRQFDITGAERLTPHRFTDALRDVSGTVAVTFRQYDGELLAAIARDDV